MQNLAPGRTLIRERTVCRRAGGVDPSTIRRWELKGLFPKRVLIGPNMVGWYEDEVDEWAATRERQVEHARPSPNPKAHVKEL